MQLARDVGVRAAGADARSARQGFWLLLATAALTVAIVVIFCLVAPDEDRNLFNFLVIAVQPASILMPIVGIKLVSSEWTQRTAMVTFSLVPQRSRVLVAKLFAGLTLSAIAFQICLIAALAATAFFGADGDATWSLSAGLIVQVAVSVVVPMLALPIALGFSRVLRNDVRQGLSKNRTVRRDRSWIESGAAQIRREYSRIPRFRVAI